MTLYCTLLEIEVLTHYYCTPGDFPRMDAPAVKEAINKFVNLRLLYACPDGEKQLYKANYDALEPYINALCGIPLPVQQWVIPYES